VELEPTLTGSGGERLEQVLLRHFLAENELDVAVNAGHLTGYSAWKQAISCFPQNR
jgi:hypothetical protein